MTNKMKKISKSNVPLIDFAKFRGKQAALVDGKIVAVGKSSKEAFEKAKKQFPQRSSEDIILLSVPQEEIFIYFVIFE